MRVFVITTSTGHEPRYTANSEAEAVAQHNATGSFQWQRGRRVWVRNPEPITAVREVAPEPPTKHQKTDYLRALLGE